MSRSLTSDRQHGPWLPSAPMRARGSVQVPNRAAAPIRLLLIADHTIVRAALRALIESRPGIAVIGEVRSSAEATEIAARMKPEIILIDPDPRGDGDLAALPELLAAANGARVLVLTGDPERELHQRALRQGAMGVVLKDQGADMLIKAIERVHAGEAWVDRGTMGRMLARLSTTPRPPDGDAVHVEALTRREREVVSLAAEGLRNRQIGARLFITETTVRHHLTAIFRKLGVSGRLELLVFAYRHHLVPLPKSEL